MIGAERLRHGAGVGQLVPAALGEAHGGSAHRAIRQTRHPLHHRGRVHPAREECAQRHVADEPDAHGLGEHRLELLEAPRFRALHMRTARHVPVLHQTRLPPLPDEVVAGGNLGHALQDGGRGRYAAEGEIVVERLRGDLPLEPAVLQEPLQLGGERQVVGVVDVVERLLAGAVPREQEAPVALVPERDREHAAEARHPVGAVLLVAVDDRLRVRSGGEPMASGNQLVPQLLEVVDLAVEHHDDRPVLVEHGLIARRQIDDRQAAVPQPHAPLEVKAVGIGATMGHRGGHAAEELARDRVPRVRMDDAGDPTHVSRPSAHRRAGRGRRRGNDTARPFARR
jgi:hypothetical protein